MGTRPELNKTNFGSSNHLINGVWVTFFLNLRATSFTSDSHVKLIQILFDCGGLLFTQILFDFAGDIFTGFMYDLTT